MRTLLLLLLLLPSPAYAQSVWYEGTYGGKQYAGWYSADNLCCNSPKCGMRQDILNAIAAKQAQQENQPWRTQSSNQQITPVSTQTLIPPAPTTNTLPLPLPSSAYTDSTPPSHVTYQLVSVPYVVRVRHCNRVTCWYENVTRYRQERQPVRNAIKAVTQPGLNLLANTTLAPTPEEAVAELLRIANPQPNEVLYDIGCGDGRILIAATTTFGCRSVGIELNPESVLLAQSQVNIFNLQNQIRIYEGDALNFTYQHADVVTMYLYPELMQRILPLLRPRTRVVSYLHSIPGAKEHRIGEHVFYEWTTP
jgi:hypothetical protein